MPIIRHQTDPERMDATAVLPVQDEPAYNEPTRGRATSLTKLLQRE